DRVQAVDLAIAQARRWLVQQQQSRLDRQRARQFQHLLPPEIQAARLGTQEADQADALEQVVGELAVLAGGPAQQPRQPPGAIGIRAQQHVFLDRQIVEQLQVLESPRNAQGGHVRGPAPRDVLARELQGAAAWV